MAAERVRRWTLHFNVDPEKPLNVIVSGPLIGPADPVTEVLSVSDLQRVLAELRAEWAKSRLCGDYRQALDDVCERLDLDGEGN